ncbi:MAG: PQQ-dependent sugar dehydrogenase [Deltaproteobacteria bacterium]|nr:PQQ-dependent sugar dehydrogenase [Deltaproteobacteria bacterium]
MRGPAVLLPAAVLASAPGASADCLIVPSGAGPDGTVSVRAVTVVDGLEVPWGLAFLPGGDLPVTERPGRIRRVREGRLDPRPVATLDVEAQGECGLLGIAAAPDFARSRAFFVFATERGGDESRIERWTLSADGASASGPTARRDRVVLSGIPAASIHLGGRLRVGPDGLLWASTGDTKRRELSRDRASIAGKLLRVTFDGAPAPGNPVAGSPNVLSGLRNLQAFDFLDAAGPTTPPTLVVADHGPSGEIPGLRGADEVSVARPGDDLGWPEGWKCDAPAGTVAPVLVFADAAPPGGLAVYRGDKVPEWTGSVMVGTLRSRALLRLVLSPDRRSVVLHEACFVGDEAEGGLGRIRDVVSGPDGYLYLTTSNCDRRGTCGPARDRVVRVEPAGAAR